jgi:hypothetical protein
MFKFIWSKLSFYFLIWNGYSSCHLLAQSKTILNCCFLSDVTSIARTNRIISRVSTTCFL